jgi:hypothetical protein
LLFKFVIGRWVGPALFIPYFIFLQRYKKYFKYANYFIIIFKIMRPHIEALIPYRVGAR